DTHGKAGSGFREPHSCPLLPSPCHFPFSLILLCGISAKNLRANNDSPACGGLAMRGQHLVSFLASSRTQRLTGRDKSPNAGGTTHNSKRKIAPMMKHSRAIRSLPIQALEAGGFLGVAPEPIGEMPGWNLSDLYPAGGKELSVDIGKALQDAAAFRDSYLGKLEGLARQDPGGLAKAIEAYEAQSDRMGRIGSFAYLNYVTNTADPARAKLFGDAQDKLTSISTELLFFELELNRIEDEVMDTALQN